MHSIGCNSLAAAVAVVAGTCVGVPCVPFGTELGCQTVALEVGILVGTEECPDDWPFD